MSTGFQIALVGCSGYAGRVLATLIDAHPHFHRDACPEPRTIPTDDARLESLASADAVVLALPAAPARQWTEVLMQREIHRVLDLSDAHRRDPGVHYALREVCGPTPHDARLVANPGCYPTATLLALAPLVRDGLVRDDGVCVVGASGATGAGKGLRDDLHFCHLE
ncbi:MAG: hypothetical protein ACPHRO_16095, partial [Nannocystaceae bacterium]